jgi:hypothetical protein
MPTTATLTGLSNRYHDFGVSQLNFTATGTFTDDTTSVYRAIAYKLLEANGIIPGGGWVIDQNGNIVNGAYSTTPAPSMPPSGVWTTLFLRKIAVPGKFVDEFIGYKDMRGMPTTGQVPPLQQVATSGRKTFVVLQKDAATGTLLGNLGNNSSINASVNELFSLDKTTSRGDERESKWIFLKYDPNSGASPVPAVAGVDYEITIGSLTTDVVTFRFLNPQYSYKVQNYSRGYKFSDNPFWIVPNDTADNVSTTTHDFIVAVTTTSYNIKFPVVNVSATVPENQLGTNPLKTYQNQAITIEGIIQPITGLYIQIIGASSTVLSKSANEWKAEMEDRCNVVLEIKKKSNGQLMQTKEGFGPFNIVIPDVDTYTLQFKTTLK